MSGSVFSAAATLLVGILLLVGLGAGLIWFLPVALLAAGSLLGGSLLNKLRNSSLVQSEPTGIPPTPSAVAAIKRSTARRPP